MTTNPDDKRSLIISATTENDLVAGLRSIPGYIYVPMEEDLVTRMCLPAGEDRFYLQTPPGDRIVVSRRHGADVAETVNVLNQEEADCSFATYDDEVVKLHNAIELQRGLRSNIVLAEADLRRPSI